MRIFLFALLVSLSTTVYSQTKQEKCDSVSTSVLFKSGDFSIDKYNDSILFGVVLDIELANVDKIILVGHTDKHGSIEYNRNLSKQRVESVEQFLLDYLDIEISTDYYGETQLIAIEATEQSDQLNRRVEIKFYTNCEVEKNITNNTSVIYNIDQNCHIDSIRTNEHYTTNLIGVKRTKVVVIDWTRSMYAYGLQLVDWFQENEDEASFNEVFIFNDGDGKPTSEKRDGKTGGIYSGKMTDIESVVNLMETVAKKGTGGDYPENYIEALLKAQNSNTNLDTLVLIADNRACIRDYKLLDSLRLPVIVILNEIDTNDKVVNYQYLNLVAKNGGRIVFMANSISDIKFKNGQGPKPTYFSDTLIKLPKFKGNLDLAYEKIAAMKKALLRTSIPPMLLINGLELPACFNHLIPTTDVKIGCASCKMYDYTIRTHTTFKERYTWRQKREMKRRNRLRVRFELVNYKWRKIKCVKCKGIDDKAENQACLKEQKKCKTEKRTCEKNFIKAKRNLKSFKKKRRKERLRAFKKFFKRNKSKGSSSKRSGTKSEQSQ